MATVQGKFKKNARAMIKNTTMSGKVIDEGMATLVKFSHGPKETNAQFWMVHFDEDGADWPSVLRFVKAENIQ